MQQKRTKAQAIAISAKAREAKVHAYLRLNLIAGSTLLLTTLLLLGSGRLIGP